MITMSYCPKCGNEVNETMAFCPHCGTALKGPPTDQTAPSQTNNLEKDEKKEKNQHPEKGEKQEKTEHSFIGYLIGGLVLITTGVFALLELSGSFRDSGQGFAIMLFIIGMIVIIGAIYMALTSRKHPDEPI
jgi:VIT1/CCC1 family predicted Fe2+/Mn2+ transporter